ncbi:c-type cytochrome [Evansella sp. AB-rgal1]|uniref:c-type cytochrome n=1 Tax=Evansella sp. AB-rgal1 TaxID=3242696 RepID=UPI00359D93F0
MKGKPLYPFALTAILGIGLVVILSFWGLNTGGPNMAGEDGDNDEQQFSDPLELGEHVYQLNCIGCHGGDLLGGSTNIPVNALAEKYSKDEILDIIAEGPGIMLPNLVTGAEADAVAEYLLAESE